MLFFTSLLLSSAIGAFGHAVVDSPSPRKPGALSDQLCLENIVDKCTDLAGPIEAAVKTVDSNYKCNAYVCRGYQYEDNKSNLHSFKAGDVVDFHVNLVAGHRPGYAKNVSIIDPVGNKVIGDPLKTWQAWPVNNPGPDRDDLDFKITIPEGLTSTCNEGGKCVIQWYWYSLSNSQTYESCVDFVASS
ncbi:hypothetical protein HJFPF1_12054 [Paramyrothecium foliicola]|nr:hypothetical protein HJFPF1_12054 [Paramyrothecium foliicola]